jgi:hypothetical protein
LRAPPACSPRVLNGVLPRFVKSAAAHCDIINESLPEQNAKRSRACEVQRRRDERRRSIFVKDISSLRTPRDTSCKEYRFKQFLA